MMITINPDVNYWSLSAAEEEEKTEEQQQKVGEGRRRTIVEQEEDWDLLTSWVESFPLVIYFCVISLIFDVDNEEVEEELKFNLVCIYRCNYKISASAARPWSRSDGRVK